ncbi:unnamed protein product [Fraxinus pennsylvanica]|uniref:C2H2-type domain-containing protein n=1 Tax=Fraxinus pennsylvanica TaxID=56036 RepID=A0AAD2A158_9LAMI|nr:unnamed protein product [Fraxinus pennsylvanica]
MGIEQDGREVIFRDIRRYYCEYCGICRSKKSLISSHILLQHKEEIKEKEQKVEIKEGKKLNACEECGVCFKKPAHLKQHTQSHSLEIEVFWKKLLLMGVKHWIPQKRTPKCKRQQHYLEWISTRWVTTCEAPSSEPQSRLY